MYYGNDLYHYICSKNYCPNLELLQTVALHIPLPFTPALKVSYIYHTERYNFSTRR